MIGFSGRRRHGSRLLATGFRPRLTVLAAALLSTACASTPARSSFPAPADVADPASVGALLSDRQKGGPYFAGWAEGIFDSLAVSGSICTTPTTPAEVEQIVADALAKQPADAAGVYAAESALRAAFACPATPIPLTTTAGIPPMKRRLRPQEKVQCPAS